MAKPNNLFNIDTRLSQTKWRVFHERQGDDGVTWCQLCHELPATDLHEVINRVHYPPDMVNEVPDQLLACLCNWCNVTLADQRAYRKELIFQAIARYGLDAVVKAVHAFAAKVRSFNPDVKVLDLIR